jgi:DNA-binding NarL/FixJ family response regulator
MVEASDSLSPREQQVMDLVAAGLANKEIARGIDPPMSEHTVREHFRRIFRKLQVTSRAEAAAIWARHVRPHGGGEEAG